MQIDQRRWTEAQGWTPTTLGDTASDAQLVLVFAASSTLEGASWLADLRRDYPGAELLVCSTAGEIWDTHVADDSVVATAIAFESTRVASAALPSAEFESAHAAGATRSTVKVRAQPAADGGLAEIAVEDNGPGISASEREAALRRFDRPAGGGNGGNGGNGGAGLGLAIALEVAKLFGGRLALSTPEGGQGLLVSVTMPRVDATGEA